MGKYIVKRIGYIILVFFILSFLLFMIYNMLPVDKAAEAARTEIQANKKLDYNERYEYWQLRYGTNGTKFERYLRWIGLYPYADGTFNGLLQGNLGDSTKFGKPVIQILGEPLKNTAFLNIFATFLALGITIPLGIFCAVKKGTKRDVAVQVGTIIGYSLPTFIIAIVFIWLFAVILGWFPVSGMRTAGSIMIENIFALNGVGKIYFDALSGNDNEVILALQMFYISISLFGNLLIDIVYGLVDPRVRVNK